MNLMENYNMCEECYSEENRITPLLFAFSITKVCYTNATEICIIKNECNCNFDRNE